MKLLIRAAVLALMFVFAGAHAAEPDALQGVKKALSERLPQLAKADNFSVRTSPVAGIYEVSSGEHILYATADAKFIFDGDLIDLEKRVNLTEDTRSETRKNLIDELGEENMLVYTPKGEVKHTVTVFTDIYCPYCQRLHQEMDQYMAKGVKVRYVFVPFKGKKSYDASVNVWCAKDQNKAMDMAKAGEPLETKICDNPIQKHQALAAELGIRGTPAIMLENGYMNPGYVPVDKLVQQIEAMGL